MPGPAGAPTVLRNGPHPRFQHLQDLSSNSGTIACTRSGPHLGAKHTHRGPERLGPRNGGGPTLATLTWGFAPAGRAPWLPSSGHLRYRASAPPRSAHL